MTRDEEQQEFICTLRPHHPRISRVLCARAHQRAVMLPQVPALNRACEKCPIGREHLRGQAADVSRKRQLEIKEGSKKA